MYSISDANAAWEVVNARIPDPWVVVVTPEGYVYHDGIPAQWQLALGDIATVDGHPVVILRPTTFGNYEWDEEYGPDQLDEYKEALFEQEYAFIHKNKYNNTPWDQRTPAEIAEQEGVSLAAPIVAPPTDAENWEQREVAQKLFEALRNGKPTEEFENFPLPQKPTLDQPGGPTQDECAEQPLADYLYFRCGFGRARLPLSSMLKCICGQSTCPRNPAFKPPPWQERRLADAAQFKENEITREMFISLVEAAKSDTKIE